MEQDNKVHTCSANECKNCYIYNKGMCHKWKGCVVGTIDDFTTCEPYDLNDNHYEQLTLF